MLKIFDDIQSDFPKSTAARNLPLNYASGDNFRNRADAYLQSALRKGVPSLFVDIKRLYSDSEKEKIVEELVTGYEVSLGKTGHFNEEQDEKGTFSSMRLWLKLANLSVFLTQYFLFDYSR
jgi:peptide alpha-N-acetyltransferase